VFSRADNRKRHEAAHSYSLTCGEAQSHPPHENPRICFYLTNKLICRSFSHLQDLAYLWNVIVYAKKCKMRIVPADLLYNVLAKSKMQKKPAAKKAAGEKKVAKPKTKNPKPTKPAEKRNLTRHTKTRKKKQQQKKPPTLYLKPVDIRQCKESNHE